MFAELPDLDRDGNSDSNRSGGKSPWHIFLQVISVEKRLIHLHLCILADAFIQSDLQCIDYAPQN